MKSIEQIAQIELIKRVLLVFKEQFNLFREILYCQQEVDSIRRIQCTRWPKIRYTICWLFCIWSLKPISLKYLMLFNALYKMKFNSMRYTFWNNFQREISQIAQLFGKLHDLRYLSRFFIYKCFRISKRCQSSFYV